MTDIRRGAGTQPLPSLPEIKPKGISPVSPPLSFPGENQKPSSEAGDFSAYTSSFEPQKITFESLQKKNTQKIDLFDIRPKGFDANGFEIEHTLTEKQNLHESLTFVDPRMKNQISEIENRHQAIRLEYEELEQAFSDKKKLPGMSRGEMRQRRRELREQLSDSQDLLNGFREQLFDRRRFTGSVISKSQISESLTSFQPKASSAELAARFSSSASKIVEIIDFYGQRGQDDKRTEGPKLDFKKGQELVYARLLSQGAEPRKQLKNLALLEQLLANPDRALSDDEISQLEQLGIIKNAQGDLVNYSSGNKVTTADLADFVNIIDYQVSLMTEGMTEVDNRPDFSNTRLESIVNVAATALAHVEGSEAELNQALEASRALRAEVQLEKESLSKEIEDFSSERASLQKRQDFLRGVLPTLQHISSDQELIDFWQTANGETQAQLSNLGVDISEEGIIIQGKKAAPGEGFQLFQELLSREIESVDEGIVNLAAKGNALQLRLDNLGDKEIELQGMQERIALLSDKHQKNLDVLEAANNDLKSIQSNPEVWNSLTPEQRGYIDGLSSRSDTALARGQELIQESKKEVRLLEETREDLRQFIQASQSDLSASMFIIQKMLEEQSSLNRLKFMPSETDHRASELIEEADSIERRSVLAPRSLDTQDVSELIQEWQEILSDVQLELDVLMQKEHRLSLQERDRLAHYAREAKELKEYTESFIENIELRTQDRLEKMAERLSTWQQNVLQFGA